jgi:hypothetical protein
VVFFFALLLYRLVSGKLLMSGMRMDISEGLNEEEMLNRVSMIMVVDSFLFTVLSNIKESLNNKAIMNEAIDVAIKEKKSYNPICSYQMRENEQKILKETHNFIR